MAARPTHLSSTFRVGILVFDDVEELDFVGPLAVFNVANPRREGQPAWGEWASISIRAGGVHRRRSFPDQHGDYERVLVAARVHIAVHDSW